MTNTFPFMDHCLVVEKGLVELNEAMRHAAQGQDAQVTAERALTKRDPLEEGMANPQDTCLENLMNCIKGQRDMTPKDESPKSESVQYTTAEEQRRITNSPKMNEAAGPKWIECSFADVPGDKSKIPYCKESIVWYLFTVV